jgi:hypothetical protein
MTFTTDEIARAVYTEITTDPVAVDILLDEAVDARPARTAPQRDRASAHERRIQGNDLERQT